jgi:predicted DNA binding CopG/RHH family protein
MNKPKSIPDFKTEAEEIEFWETHRIQDYDNGPADDIIWDIKPEKKISISLRFEPSLIARVKNMAERLDMPYQTLIRELIRRGVREMQKADRRDATFDGGGSNRT